MKYLIKISFILVLIVSSFSCNNYLEELDPNGISTGIYWSNLEETEAALTAVYGAMYHTYIHNISVEASRADIGFPRNRLNPAGQNIVFYFKTYDNGVRSTQLKWEGGYQAIFRANQVIEGLENLEDQGGDPERWTQQMAQARFFRGLNHFYLHGVFNKGEIIIRDKVPVSNEDFNKALSSSAEVIEFFRADLQYAYENLPAAYANSADQGRVTAGAAATILGTSYLYQEEYSQAMPLFDDVIENPDYGYELVRDMELLFTNAGEFNKESIYEINYSVDLQLEDSQWDEESFNTRLARYTAPNPKGGAGTEHFFPTAWLTRAYTVEPMDSLDSRNFVDDGMGGTRMRGVPLRASAMVAVVQDLDTEYYQSPNFAEVCATNFGSFSWFKKHTNHSIAAHENETGLTPWKSGKNLTVNRLAEVYLMRAECKIQTGDISGALEDINAIRERWALQLLGPSDGSNHAFDEINYTAESLMEHLMHTERPLELSAEGHALRSIDFRRWGIAKERFEELAPQIWSVVQYPFVNAEGESAFCNRSLLQEGAGPNQFQEFELSAQNYNPDLHDYLPIPLSEIQNNSAVN